MAVVGMAWPSGLLPVTITVRAHGLYPVLVIAQLTVLAEQWIKYTRPENTGLFRVTRFVWLIAGLTLVYLVATSDHQWMVRRIDSATSANATVMRFAGRNISLIEFVNDIWSIVFVVVAASSAGASSRLS